MPVIFDALLHWEIYAVSSLGGAVAYAQNFTLEDTWKIHILKFTNRQLTSNFAGVMAFQLCLALALPPTWIFLTVGILAWRGAQGLQAIAETLDKRLGRANDAQGQGK